MIPKPADPFAVLRGAETFTIADFGERLLLVFFLPGDWLLWALVNYAAPAAKFLELSVADYGGVFSGVVSALLWLALLVATSVIYVVVREFDQALTARIVQIYTDTRRRIRFASNLIEYRIRRMRGLERVAARDAAVIELTEEIEVSVDELRVLHAHGQLAPGYSMSISDLAATLGARKHDIERLLSRLVRLNFVRSTLGGHDGESAYTLTPTGQAFLLFRRMAAGNMRRTPPGRPAAPQDHASSRQDAALSVGREPASGAV